LLFIPDDKTRRLDGLAFFFFKKSWVIIGVDFIAVIQYFFDHYTLSKCINATRIALVPRIENPTYINDFRPISYCNVMHKCISKIIVNRLKLVLSNKNFLTSSIYFPGKMNAKTRYHRTLLFEWNP